MKFLDTVKKLRSALYKDHYSVPLCTFKKVVFFSKVFPILRVYNRGNDKMCRKRDFREIDLSYLVITPKINGARHFPFLPALKTLLNRLDKSLFRKIYRFWVEYNTILKIFLFHLLKFLIFSIQER